MTGVPILRATQESPIEKTYEKTAPTSIMRLADRIEEIRRDYTRLYGSWNSLTSIDRRDLTAKINANVTVLYQETLGYAEGRARTDEFVDDIEATMSVGGVSDPLVVLRVIVDWLEVFDLYASSDRVPPDFSQQIKNMVIRGAAPLPPEKQPKTHPRFSQEELAARREQRALADVKAFEEGEPSG